MEKCEVKTELELVNAIYSFRFDYYYTDFNHIHSKNKQLQKTKIIELRNRLTTCKGISMCVDKKLFQALILNSYHVT